MKKVANVFESIQNTMVFATELLVSGVHRVSKQVSADRKTMSLKVILDPGVLPSTPGIAIDISNIIDLIRSKEDIVVSDVTINDGITPVKTSKDYAFISFNVTLKA